MTRPEERHWVEQAQQDPKHFEVLYRAFVEDIYRFIYYKTSTKEVAEDLTAQVFMHALEHLSRFHYTPGARFSSWLYTIARNQVIDHYRQHHPADNLEDHDTVAQPETSSSQTDRKLEQERIQQVLNQLPPPDKELLQLRLWDDKSYLEIAQIVQSNVVAVRARYSRALKKFKQLYLQHYGQID